jgi:hypothetical protein
VSARTPKAPIPSLALTAARAAASLDMSEDHFREHVAPDLKWIRQGRKRVVSVAELEAWLSENAARVLDG